MEDLEANSKQVIEQPLRFYREESGRWYVDLPEYPGPKGDLQMVAGAESMLSIISQGRVECTLVVSEYPFENAEVLRLVTGYQGEHGDYVLEQYHGAVINHKMWLCPVITFVFGRLPDVIYFSEQEPRG